MFSQILAYREKKEIKIKNKTKLKKQIAEKHNDEYIQELITKMAPASPDVLAFPCSYIYVIPYHTHSS